MNKYVKENVVINATEKAYETIYKDKGYMPYKKTNKKKEEVKDISKMNKEDLLAYASENHIEIPKTLTKVDDIKKFIKEVEEKKEGADK